MRRVVCLLVLFVVFLTGCAERNAMDSAMALRERFLSSAGCSFDAMIVADYSDMVFEFGLACRSDSTGKVLFEVTSPESISGITGYIDASSGNLTFDDMILGFSTIADGYLTPVSVPWIMVKGILGGYLSACTVNGSSQILFIDDTYLSEIFQLQLTLDEEGNPAFCEVIWKDRRILSMKIENFAFL